MIEDLAQEAISQALSGEWEKAVETNRLILNINPNDTEALNRLARAYSELGDLNNAKKASQQVLKIDPFNPIARKALEKWKTLRKGKTYSYKPINPQVFLEEPGKTKIVTLLYPGCPKVLAKLDSGDEVKLNYHSHKVSILTHDGKYIGRLPDDLSARLRKLIELGNEYKVFIKSLDKNEIKVFIRETKRAEKISDKPSFPTEKIEYIPFAPPELVHKKDIILDTEENEEI